MGYNGSNRKGYDSRYRGLSKSSMRSSNSMLFGEKGIVTGLFDIGPSITRDTVNYDTGEELNTTANKGEDTNTAIVVIASVLGVAVVILIIVYAPLILGVLVVIGMFLGLGKR